MIRVSNYDGIIESGSWKGIFPPRDEYPIGTLTTMATTRKDLEGRTIMELRSFAREHDIPLRRNWTKDEIIQAILRMVRPKRGRKPKPVLRQPKGKTAAGTHLQSPVDQAPASKGKRPSPVKPSRPPEGKGTSRPESTSQNELTLMVRNADTLFAYWRTPKPDVSVGETRSSLGKVLRIHDLAGSAQGLPGKDYYDIPLDHPSGTRYVSLRIPGHRFVGEVGVFQNGVFRAQATSLEVETPRDRVSPPTARAAGLFHRVYGISEGASLLLQDIPAVFSDNG